MVRLFTTVGDGNDGPLWTRTPFGRDSIPPPPFFGIYIWQYGIFIISLWSMRKKINLDTELVLQKYEELQNINKTSEFFNVSYSVINRILNELGVVHIKNNKWTKQTLTELALQYDTLSEFYKDNISAYSVAVRMGIKDEIFSHMVKNFRISKYSKYPEDNGFLFEEASKYNTKKEFKLNNSKLHGVSYKRGLLPIMFPNDNSNYFRDIYVFLFHNTNAAYVGLTCNIKERYKTHNNNNKSPVYRYIQQTKEPFEFKILTDNPLPKHDAAKKECEYIREYSLNGWSLLNTSKGGNLGGGILIWDYNKLKETALLYKTKVDFRKYNGKAYHSAVRMKIIDDICGHMIKLYPNWSDDELFTEGIKYSTKGEFQKNSINAYNQSRRRGILEQVCSHMTSPRISWTPELLYDEAKKYNTRSEFQKNCPGGYESAINKGILDEICSHMKKIVYHWSVEEIFEISKNYDSIASLRKDYESVYRKATKLGIITELFNYQKKGPTEKWTYDKLVEVSKLCKNRSELQRKFHGAYNFAKKFNYLDIVFPM